MIECLDHYSGPNCENYDCVGYCLNNGTCEIDSITNNRTCNCLEGFNGTRCEFEIVFNPIYQARSYLKFIIYSLALTLSICLIAIGCGYSFQNGNLKNVYLRRNLHRNLPRMPNIYPFGRKNHGTSLLKGDFSFNKLEDEEILVQNDH
ncbi:unnamed protein product [Brachionus calyciflorus]|uniref:EGF-like domain-containing protein n=1 Tax=Brachionus calyciflorus TaxID=104777 RepID=A0A813M9D1_9BILA|nr:unnamed protein product [Brachionus calyciflorus]